MIAGMDEAGRGPPIGPMVMGLAILEEDVINKFTELGVNDSKALSSKKREEFKDIILKYAEVAETLVISAQEIDSKRKSITLNQIEIEGFRQLLKPYSKKVNELQLDAIGHFPEKFANEFKDLISGKIDARHKGDSIFISVGAASILAKVERDKQVAELQQQMLKIDPELPQFGAGYPQQSKPFLEAYVIKYQSLPDFARKSWKTCSKILDQHTNKQQGLGNYFSK